MAELLNAMVAEHVIADYALFGAVAQMRYTEPVATVDADVRVVLRSEGRVEMLRPLYQFCSERGYEPEGEAIRVGDWPVRFIPTFSELTSEAVAKAETPEFEGVVLRVVRAAHLVAIALSVGRAKDWTRILALLHSGKVTKDGISEIAARHGLRDRWSYFVERFLGG